MQLLLGLDAEVAQWVSQRTGTPFYQPVAAIGWADKDNNVAGGCVFHNYDHSNIDLAIAVDRPVTRGVIRAICHYVFVQLGCQRATIRTRKSNKAACRGAQKLGFKYECSLERWFGSENGVQFKMTRDNCRWI